MSLVPDTDLVREFRHRLTGRVIAPDDDGYDEARTIFYGGYDRRPAVIARVADAADVSTVIRLAREGAWSSPSAAAVTASPATARPTGSSSISRG
jgi:hypothetical protein